MVDFSSLGDGESVVVRDTKEKWKSVKRRLKRWVHSFNQRLFSIRWLNWLFPIHCSYSEGDPEERIRGDLAARCRYLKKKSPQSAPDEETRANLLRPRLVALQREKGWDFEKVAKSIGESGSTIVAWLSCDTNMAGKTLTKRVTPKLQALVDLGSTTELGLFYDNR
jgi:hypothetical protein